MVPELYIPDNAQDLPPEATPVMDREAKSFEGNKQQHFISEALRSTG